MACNVAGLSREIGFQVKQNSLKEIMSQHAHVVTIPDITIPPF